MAVIKTVIFGGPQAKPLWWSVSEPLHIFPWKATASLSRPNQKHVVITVCSLQQSALVADGWMEMALNHWEKRNIVKKKKNPMVQRVYPLLELKLDQGVWGLGGLQLSLSAFHRLFPTAVLRWSLSPIRSRVLLLPDVSPLTKLSQEEARHVTITGKMINRGKMSDGYRTHSNSWKPCVITAVW